MDFSALAETFAWGLLFGYGLSKTIEKLWLFINRKTTVVIQAKESVTQRSIAGVLTKYSDDQPRVPAGSPEGGQFAPSGGGAGGAPASVSFAPASAKKFVEACIFWVSRSAIGCGLIPWSSNFLFSRVRIRSLTAAMLLAASVLFDVRSL